MLVQEEVLVIMLLMEIDTAIEQLLQETSIIPEVQLIETHIQILEVHQEQETRILLLELLEQEIIILHLEIVLQDQTLIIPHQEVLLLVLLVVTLLQEVQEALMEVVDLQAAAVDVQAEEEAEEVNLNPI